MPILPKSTGQVANIALVSKSRTGPTFYRQSLSMILTSGFTQFKAKFSMLTTTKCYKIRIRRSWPILRK